MPNKPIRYTRQFNKHYRARIAPNPKLAAKFTQRLKLFAANPSSSALNDHALSGSMADLRAFSVTGDIRVIYYKDEACYRLMDIGTHAQVYK
jgi:addiction module RelE/StbE family toxin